MLSEKEIIDICIEADKRDTSMAKVIGEPNWLERIIIGKEYYLCGKCGTRNIKVKRYHRQHKYSDWYRTASQFVCPECGTAIWEYVE